MEGRGGMGRETERLSEFEITNSFLVKEGRMSGWSPRSP